MAGDFWGGRSACLGAEQSSQIVWRLAQGRGLARACRCACARPQHAQSAHAALRAVLCDVPQKRVDAAAGERGLPLARALQLVGNVAALAAALPALDAFAVMQARWASVRAVLGRSCRGPQTAGAAAPPCPLLAWRPLPGTFGPAPNSQLPAFACATLVRPRRRLPSAPAADVARKLSLARPVLRRGAPPDAAPPARSPSPSPRGSPPGSPRPAASGGSASASGAGEARALSRSPDRGGGQGQEAAGAAGEGRGSLPGSPGPASSRASVPSPSASPGASSSRQAAAQQGAAAAPAAEHTTLSFSATAGRPAAGGGPAAAAGGGGAGGASAAALAFLGLLESAEALVVQVGWGSGQLQF